MKGAAIPNCWTTFRGVNNQGASNDWSIVSSSSNTGIYSAYVKYEAVSNSAEDWMVSPLLDLTNAISASVSYWERDTYICNDCGTNYKLKVSTNSQTNHSDFIDLVSYSESDMSNTAWTQNTVDLSAYVGQQVYVAFVMTQDDGDDWYLDDIQFSRVQGASVVADLSVSSSLNPFNACSGTFSAEQSFTVSGSGLITDDGINHQWVKTTMDYTNEAGRYNAIVVDSSDHVHVVHINGGNYKIRHSVHDGNSWNSVNIKNCEGTYCWDAQMVIDDNDELHVAYTTYTSWAETLVYMHYDGTNWTSEEVSSNVRFGQTGIAVDSNNHPHISYAKPGNYCGMDFV